ncbi:sugar phosphate nucleotidyltransferase [Desulfurella sp.]|uniref:sugar phosphate nucleotidyltransferase n=1 Tax=Desulfurella sp. TaxID=1962857 RepID=UPI003D13FA5D
MRTILMAGGFGTRLRPLTIKIPKPMVPIANKPIMFHVINLLKRHKFINISALLFFQHDVIRNYFQNGQEFGVNLSYVLPDEDYGTAGAVKYSIIKENINEPILVISSDILCDFDLTKALESHKTKNAKATIILTHTKDPTSYGIVITDDKSNIEKFLEKPSWGEVFSDLINTGIYILEKEAYDFIPENVEFDFSKDLFPLLLEKGIKINAYIDNGYWKDIGNISEYFSANMDCLESKIQIDVEEENIENTNFFVGKNTNINFTSNLEGHLIIGENSIVEPKSKIKNSIIGKNVRIGKNCNIENSIIWDNTQIAQDSEVRNSIILDNVSIGIQTFIDDNCVVSSNVKIGDNVIIKPNIKIWPNKEIESGAILSSSLIWAEKWSYMLFAKYGVTGLANLEITPEFCTKLGSAYATSLKEKSTVVCGRDTHPVSRLLNRALMSGVLSCGVNVEDLSDTPIPIIRYIIKTTGKSGGFYLRRSPFDTEFVDIKFFDNNGMDIVSSKEKTIERLFFREDFRKSSINKVGNLNFPYHTIESYNNSILNKLNIERIKEQNLRVVIDYSFGSASKILPNILGKIGIEVISLNAFIEPNKTTRTKEEFEQAQNTLSIITKSTNSQLGIMLDSGCEKVFLVDNHGEIIDNEKAVRALILLQSQRLKNKKIILPVNASFMCEKLCNDLNIDFYESPFTMKELMYNAYNLKAYFSADANGGFLFSDYQYFFDGIYSTLKILELLSLQDKNISQLANMYESTPKSKVLIPCPFDKKGSVMRKLFEDTQNTDRLTTFGIKIYHKDIEGWVLLYPEEDKSYFAIEANAKTQKDLENLIDTYKEMVKKYI